MAYYAPAKRSAYQVSAVLTASQPQLLVMLYDGAHRFLVQAASALREQRTEEAHRKLRRAELIIGHLQSSLIFGTEADDLATHLSSLFAFCLHHLNGARVHRDPLRVEEVDRLLSPLRDAWSQVG